MEEMKVANVTISASSVKGPYLDILLSVKRLATI